MLHLPQLNIKTLFLNLHQESKNISLLKLVDLILNFSGGDLHNQIGLGNDALTDLYKNLSSAGFNQIVSDVKDFLDSSKTIGGAGCTPAAHHGGQYNGKAGLN